MPDLWMDVDVALSEVPITLLPLIDDTDFKAREESVTYNQSGLDLLWNFITPAGAMTQTAVTPTDTGGAYDWVSQGNGLYTIEIPASGGGTINNDTEGFGWFTGFATGILPWRGPVIGFRAAGLNAKLIEDAYSATRALGGTALPDAAAEADGGLYTRGSGAGQIVQDANGRVDVNLKAINEVATKLEELMDKLVTAASVVDNSIIADLVSKEATSDYDDYVNTTDSLQAIRDKLTDIEADTNELQGDDIPGTIGALNDISAANVNTEVSDVMKTDAVSLPGQGAPSNTPTMEAILGWLYKAFRNRKTQTATLWQLLADNESTVDSKATVSDDGTTAIKQEIISGA